MKIICIGSGNVATHLSLALKKKGHIFSQIYSRSEENAEILAKQLNCKWTSSIHDISNDADIYLFAVKDAALEELVAKLKPNNGICIHTAGSVPITIFEKYSKNYGVMYPLQTFSKEQLVDFKKIPFFIEANNSKNEDIIFTIATELSEKVQRLSSEKRKYLHLSAVFACNFTNHMYTIANNILEQQGLDFSVILPLIDETASKVHHLSPKEAQTGPAVRFDHNIIEKQIKLIDKETANIYLSISKNIYKTHQK